MRRFRPAALAPTMALLAACSGAAVVNALTPRGGYTVVRDEAYGARDRQRLDVYLPDGAGPATPVVVFFYGGGWKSGRRQDYLFVGQAFAARGYVTVIPDYRVYPEARFPDFLEDAAAAVAWVRRERSADAPLHLVGHSAGAYIAAMLALDETWLDRAGVGRDTLTAAVGLAGPYDFLPLRDPVLIEIFGPEEAQPGTQPINHVDAGAPPMLLVTGADDQTVRPLNSARLSDRLRAAGVPAEVIVYEGLGHIAIVGTLAAPLRGLAPLLDDIERFLRRAERRHDGH